MIFETISPEESIKKEPEFEKDFDYLRCKYNILTPEKILKNVKEDIITSKNKENLNFKDLKNYLAKEKNILDKSMIEIKFVQEKIKGFRSKSAVLNYKKNAKNTCQSCLCNFFGEEY